MYENFFGCRENAPSGPIQLNTPGSNLFFGGRPEDYDIRPGASATDTAYKGCLADISINGKRLDFTDSSVKNSAVGQKCITMEEMEAMALEKSRPEANGRTISKFDEEEDEEILPQPLTTTSTTTTPKPLPPPEEPDYGIFDKWGKEEEGEETSKKDEWDEDIFKETEVPPTPYMKCALPYREAPSEDVSETINMVDGVMFGNFHRTSRLEYIQQRIDGTRSEYSIDFKTTSGEGLIFMWTIFEKTDYIALFMRKGFLHFAFDSGAGPAFLNSTVTYNDTKWHTASVSRYYEDVQLWCKMRKIT